MSEIETKGLDDVEKYESFVRLFMDTHYSEKLNDADIMAMLFLSDDKKKKALATFDVIDKNHRYSSKIKNKFDASRPNIIITAARLFDMYYDKVSDLTSTNIATLASYYAFMPRDAVQESISSLCDKRILSAIGNLYPKDFMAQSLALDYILSSIREKSQPLRSAVSMLRQNAEAFRFTDEQARGLTDYYFETYVAPSKEGTRDK